MSLIKYLIIFCAFYIANAYVTCPDGESNCPSGSQCCVQNSGEYSCCSTARECCDKGTYCCNKKIFNNSKNIEKTLAIDSINEKSLKYIQ